MSQSTTWDDFSVSPHGESTMFPESEETEQNKFSMLDYIPSSRRMKYFHNLYIICSVVAVLILIVIITIVFTKNDVSSAKTSMISSDFRENIFLLVNDTKLMKFKPYNKNLSLVLEASENSVITAFVIHDDNRVYWTESKASRLILQSFKYVKILLEEKRFTPEGVGLDVISENIYVVDKTAGVLVVTNLRNGYYTILLTDLINAYDVVLDYEEGIIFVLQHSHSILRANMDGSEPTEIITNNGITALTIDTARKRVYWINNFINIESSNYNGEKRQSVFTDTVTISSITILGDHLFWTWSSHQQSTTLLSCKIDFNNDTCKDHATHEINAIGNVKSIHGYSTLVPLVSSPCQVNNGGCKQLCLSRGMNQSICACHMGWQLNPDQQSCHEVRDFVLYPYGDVIRTCSLNGKQEIFWPTPYRVKGMNVKTEIDFDYDLKNDYFYFSDDHNIHRLKLKSYVGQEIVLSLNNSDMIIEDIAYDWYTNNIYYGQRHVNANLEHSLVAFNPRLGEAYRKTIDVFEDEHFKARSYAMVLEPSKGYLFVAVAQENRETDIFRVLVDGTTFETGYHFFADGVQDHRFFSIDYAASRLYEIDKTDDEESWIFYKSIEWSGVTFTGKANFGHARTISLHQQWIYLSNFASIHRCDKETTKNGIDIAPRVQDPAKKIVGVRIISKEVQFTGADNSCAKNNGDCEQFCFSGSKAICACKDGQVVKDDGRCY